MQIWTGKRMNHVSVKVRQWKLSSLKNRKTEGLNTSEPYLKDLWDTTSCVNTRIVGVPEGEKRGGRENMKWWLRTSQICWKTQTPRNINSEAYTKKYYNQAFERTKNLESSKGEVTHHTQGIINKITSRFLNRNFGDQEVVR